MADKQVSRQVNNTQVNNTQVNATQVNNTQVNGPLLTDHGHDVERGLEGVVVDVGLAEHHPRVADQVTGHGEARPAVPQAVLPIGRQLLLRVLLTKSTNQKQRWTY